MQKYKKSKIFHESERFKKSFIYKMPVDLFGRTSNSNTQSIVYGLTMSQANNTFLRRDRLNNMTDKLDMNGNTTENVPAPIHSNDDATKDYVDHIVPTSHNLKIVPDSSLTFLGSTNQSLPPSTGDKGTDAYIISFNNNNSGIPRKLWLALYKSITTGPPVSGNVFLKIHADGELCIENLAYTTTNTGMDTNGLACDLLFSPLGGPFYANSLQECNMHTPTQFGGYFTFDMSFKQTLKIELYNATRAVLKYWIQPFVARNPSLPPYIADLTLRSDVFRYTNTSYGSEYILIDTAGKGNGVYSKYIRMHIIGISRNWWESRIQMYDGSAPPKHANNTKTPWTPYNYGNYSLSSGYLDANNQSSKSTCIFMSSRLEDFYLNHEESGLLAQINSNGTTAPSIDSATTISFYRNFKDSMPSVGSGRRLVVTLNSRDEQVGQSGSFHVIGVGYYYS